MSKQRIELTAEPRTTGRSSSRHLRDEKKVPAIVYGATENKSVYLDENTVKKYHVRAYENALFNLKSSDSKLNGVVVLMKDVDVHPLSRRPQHVDLFAIDLKKTVRVSVEVRLEGKPLGLAEGGLLNVVNRQIDIECLPTEIPEGLTADISHLGIGDALHVSDIKMPSGVKVLSPMEMTVAVVNLQDEEKETPAATAEAAPAAAAPAAAGAKATEAKAETKAAPAKDKK